MGSFAHINCPAAGPPHPSDRTVARLAKEEGVSLNQCIAIAIAQKVGVVETASHFLRRRAGNASAAGMMPFLERAKREAPPSGDEV